MDYIILTGIQHSGKTTAGKLTAERIGCDFYDIDEIIEKKTGLSCRRLYAEKGTEAFKEAETEACIFLQKQLQSRRNETEKKRTADTAGKFLQAVIAAGGGVCDNPHALSVLETIGKFIYLHVGEHTAFERICVRSKRTGSFPAYIENRFPKNDTERRSIFHEVYIHRTAEYKKRAKIHIGTEGLTPDEVSEALCAALQITIKK